MHANLDNPRNLRPAGYLRRLAALCYDLILLFGVLALAVFLFILPYDLLTGTPFRPEGWRKLAFQLYLATVAGAFFMYFWVRDGQTLGMRTWHLRLVRANGGPLRVRDALARLAWAVICLAPLSLLWILIDRDRLTWYDRLSHTRVLRLPGRGEGNP